MAVQFFRKATKTIVIICNVVFAIFLMLGCYGNSINLGNDWIAGLFSLTAFYFLIINSFFIVFWLFVKRWLSLISLTTIIICWIPLQHVFQFRFSVSFDAKKERNVIRVMSWNVEHFDIAEHRSHPEVKSEMIDLINEYNPDIACFQEMVGSDSVIKSINYIPQFKKKLKMEDYHFSYFNKLDFDKDHHFGIIIFSKFPLINKQTYSPEQNSYNSTFQSVDVVRNTDTFRVFNVHLETLRFSPNNRNYLNDPSIENEYDIQESKSILSKFKKGYIKHHWQSNNMRREIDKSIFPVIVCGDLNDLPNSYAYNTIGKGLNNTFKEKGSLIGSTYDGISPTLRIDNIFTDNKFSVEQYIRIKKSLSDHFPIIADIIFHKD
jgi:endonuclease/exonuclease/phosphatase family metal-dependent hydrolase